jgi:hypothetical protein
VSRPRFSKKFEGCHLRVEQIGLAEWHGAVYNTFMYDSTDNETGVLTRKTAHLWDVFSCMSEESAKRSAVVTVENRYPPDIVIPGQWREMQWFDDSSLTEEQWSRELKKTHFPGYARSRGLERFSVLDPSFNAESSDDESSPE